MADAYIGEIRPLPYTFAPVDWARCEGQTIQVNQQAALYSVIGTNFGGDGRITFMLPNLAGRSPMHIGAGIGLTPRRIGNISGADRVTLQISQLPMHNHCAQVSKKTDPETSTPSADTLPHMLEQISPRAAKRAFINTPDLEHTTNLAENTVTTCGQSQPHENRQPYLGMYFCISMNGLYPSRN